jgi:DNA-binding transcriptional ArsR family regulator
MPLHDMHCDAMDAREANSRDILACLGHPSRFRLVLSLLEGERCVTELAGQVGLSQSCTTRHLQYLEREGLARGVRQGKRVVFQLRSDRARVRDLLAWVTATSHDREPQRVSGADIHTNGPDVPNGPDLSRSPAEAPMRGARNRPRSGRKWDRPPESSPPAEAGIPLSPSEMEDWLL